MKIVAEALNSIGQLDAAAELYERLGNIQAVINMAVKAENWQRAFQLVKQYPEYKKDVYIPYAHLMARENQFIEAQKGIHSSINYF